MGTGRAELRKILESPNFFSTAAASQVGVTESRRASKTSAPCSGLPSTSNRLVHATQDEPAEMHYTMGKKRMISVPLILSRSENSC